MTLPTNKGKRDAILAERVAAIGGDLVKVETSKYGSDLTSYYLYITFPGDPGPANCWEHGKETVPYHAYRVIIRGGLDKLDAITSNPAHLAIHAYRERRNYHWDTRKLEDLQRALDYARKEYGRSSVDVAIMLARGQEDGALVSRWNTDLKRLQEAVQAYDAEHAAMVAVIGEWPKSEDNYYPRY